MALIGPRDTNAFAELQFRERIGIISRMPGITIIKSEQRNSVIYNGSINT